MIIYLVGFMGSGKSTVAKRLASDMELNFYDLDSLIETDSGSSIADIFQNQGEESFREIERRVLRTTGSLKSSVIACGGGTPCFFDNISFMNSVGKTVYIEMSISQLLSRLEGAKSERPLLNGLKGDKLKLYIAKTLEERSHFYSKANITVSGFNLDIKKLKLLLLNP
jgi:shikimate kinase